MNRTVPEENVNVIYHASKQEEQQRQRQQITPSGLQSSAPVSVVRLRRGPLIVGKSLNSVSNAAVAAAHLWYKKIGILRGQYESQCYQRRND
jgi:hypothetical protein